MDILRQLTPEVATAGSLKVFQPQDAARGSRGLTVDYYLPAKASQVTVTILDGSGQTVGTFRSPKPGTRPAENDNPFRRGPSAPTANAGINQYTWNLRYPGAISFPGMVLWGANISQGPTAVPGAYSARIDADGQSQTVGFHVLPNPHSTASPADLQAEFDLDEQVVKAESQANQAVIDVRALRSQVEDRMKSQPSLHDDGAALVQQLTDIEETIYQPKSHASEDPLNFPIKLNNRIGHLMGVIEGGYDARPTDQTYAVFKDLQAELEKVLARFDTVKSGALAAFNQKLAAAGAAPVGLKASGSTK
jgi:hypothetical protein